MSTGSEHEDRTPLDVALGRLLDGEPEPGDAELVAAAAAADPRVAAELRRLLRIDNLLAQAHEPDPGAFADGVAARLAAEEDGEAFTRSLFDQIPAGPGVVTPAPPVSGRTFGYRRFWAITGVAAAATVLLAVGGMWVGGVAFGPRTDPAQEVAWLTNGRNCRWAPGGGPSGGLTPGKRLQLESGLAELSFPSGAAVVMQGPATMEVRSAGSVRLVRGRMTARVPEPARGFEVLSPEGRVVDLGTEFGLSVGDDGAAEVYVFKGEVEAHPAGTAGAGGMVNVGEKRAARIGTGGVSLDPVVRPDDFVRVIDTPPAVSPRTLALDFHKAAAGTLLDATGTGTGLTHRLPGTGYKLPAHDPNLRLDPAGGRLQLTTTESDLNGVYKLARGEYVGVRLSDLGFTGAEDFAVSAVFPKTPALGEVDQFGLYAGARNDRHVRGGLLRPGGKAGVGPSTQFLVSNDGGKDANLHMVGLAADGDDIVLTLQRVGGHYSLSAENRTSGESTTLAIRHPGFLDPERDLFVGVFGATPWRNVPRTISVKELRATVWVRR